MKRKTILQMLFATMMCVIAAPMLAIGLNVHPLHAFGGAMTVSALISFAPSEQGQVNDVVLKQMWETELINKFRFEHNWMSLIPSKDKYVNNNVINLTEIGADPEVLINNTTYPIPVVSQDDDNIPVALKKFDTVNTEIKDDELYALPYDKEGSVIRNHREALEEKTSIYGLHSLAPASDSLLTPVINTTGEAFNGRKRLVAQDVINLKDRYDKALIPKKGRVLVLCTDHVNDLLSEDKTFRDRYQNHTTGEIAKMYYGFTVFEDIYNPVYAADNSKKAFAAVAEGTDRSASTSFFTKRSFKARGSVKMYKRISSEDPENRKTVVGFQLYHVVLPTKVEGVGAIVSGPGA